MYIITNKDDQKTYELYHYGVLGQKWGIRRYQDASGKLTALGKEHYGSNSAKRGKEAYKHAQKVAYIEKSNKRAIQKSEKKMSKAAKRGNSNRYEKYKKISNLQKKANKLINDEYKESIKTAKKYGDEKIQAKLKNMTSSDASKKYAARKVGQNAALTAIWDAATYGALATGVLPAGVFLIPIGGESRLATERNANRLLLSRGMNYNKELKGVKSLHKSITGVT